MGFISPLGKFSIEDNNVKNMKIFHIYSIETGCPHFGMFTIYMFIR